MDNPQEPNDLSAWEEFVEGLDLDQVIEDPTLQIEEDRNDILDAIGDMERFEEQYGRFERLLTSKQRMAWEILANVLLMRNGKQWASLTTHQKLQHTIGWAFYLMLYLRLKGPNDGLESEDQSEPDP